MEWGLQRDGGARLPEGEALECLVHETEALRGVVVPVEENSGVGRVIELLVKSFEPLIGQGGNDPGIAARIQPVGDIRKEGLLRVFGEEGVGRGVSSFHLVIDDPFEAQGGLRVIDVVMPSLLLENARRDAGVKDRVQVDIDEVVEVLEVLAGHGVAGLVRVGEGIEKGLEGSLEELHEGLLHGVFPRPAQYRVLEDVGHARGIRGRRAENDAEDLVLVVVDQRQELGSRGRMPVYPGQGLDLGNLFLPQQLETIFHSHAALLGGVFDRMSDCSAFSLPSWRARSRHASRPRACFYHRACLG